MDKKADIREMTKTLNQFRKSIMLKEEASNDSLGVRLFHKKITGEEDIQKHLDFVTKHTKNHGGKVHSHNVKFNNTKFSATIVKVPKINHKQLVGNLMRHKSSILATTYNGK